jgi:DNA-binding NarL/FixJ family response regulator
LSSGSEPDVVVSELTLPDGDGAELHQWLSEHRPSLARRMVFTTSDGARHQAYIDELKSRVLHKPVGATLLLQAIHFALPGDLTS